MKGSVYGQKKEEVQNEEKAEDAVVHQLGRYAPEHCHADPACQRTNFPLLRMLERNCYFRVQDRWKR